MTIFLKMGNINWQYCGRKVKLNLEYWASMDV